MPVNKLLSGHRSILADPVANLITKIGQISSSRSLSDEKIATYAISTESLDSNDEQTLVNIYNNIETTVKTIASDLGIAVEDYNIESATIAGIYATNPKAVLATRLKNSNPDAMIIGSSVSDGNMERPVISTEAYDERDNRNAQLNSIVLNLLASRQDDFSETFYPTIVVNPAEVGVTLSVKLYYVYNDFKRSVTGALANYSRKNLIHAYRDAEILKNELTRAVPVYRSGGADDNTDKFVPVSLVPAWVHSLGNGISVTTAALKVDTRVDILGISQTNELLNSGLMGPSDSLDTFIKLESIFVKFTDGTNTDVIRIPVDNISAATYTYAPQGNYRRMILNLDTDGIVLDGDTVNVTGVAPASLAELVANKARVQLSITGNASLDKNDGSVSRGSLGLVALRNATGQLVNGAAYTSLAAKVASAEVIGYTQQSYRANSNIRQRGQLLDTQTEFRVVAVPYRSPMCVLAPAITANGDENAQLQALINATGTRISNEAVTALLKTEVALKSYNPVANANGDLPEISAIGQLVGLKPVYYYEKVDLALNVDSLKSHERFKDIRSAIVEKIRYYANEMYRESEYKAGAALLTGNVGFKPTIIVGTDVVTYNYISTDGDLRTLGDSFDLKIVSTLDDRVKGRIYISLGVFDSARNTAINPLNFGNLLYSPEMTVVMPVSRDGQTSKELIVTPRFIHINNFPGLAVLEITNLPSVTGKVSVNTSNV